MSDSIATREDIRRALREELEPLDYAYAMWEGGATAFSRIDEWSDIDLYVDAAEEHAADVVAGIERALESVGGVELKYEIPQPAWHGHWQAFYRLKSASPYLLIDIVVMAHGNPNKFIQREIHGEPIVHFDKRGVVRSEPFDADAFIAKLRERAEALRVTTDIFGILTLKELNRGNDIEAMSFYHGFVLRPLVEALRIGHAPARYNFHTRYIYYDLPREVIGRLTPFFFVADAAGLRARSEEAAAWIAETLDAIDFDDVKAKLG